MTFFYDIKIYFILCFRRRKSKLPVVVCDYNDANCSKTIARHHLFKKYVLSNTP